VQPLERAAGQSKFRSKSSALAASGLAAEVAIGAAPACDLRSVGAACGFRESRRTICLVNISAVNGASNTLPSQITCEHALLHLGCIEFSTASGGELSGDN